MGCAGYLDRLREMDVRIEEKNTQLKEAILTENQDMIAILKGEIAALETSRSSAEDHVTKGQENESKWLMAILQGLVATGVVGGKMAGKVIA
tara:strand:+ start:5247 stop:5522 length:276 start_codon:yes stop_codon:yes gene_type:complete